MIIPATNIYEEARVKYSRNMNEEESKSERVHKIASHVM